MLGDREPFPGHYAFRSPPTQPIDANGNVDSEEGRMGATGREDHIELFVDMDEFYRRVDFVSSYLELEWLGFKTESFEGSFRARRLPELFAFCTANPEYHMMTYTDQGRIANKYVPGKKLYLLAKGDKNPCLVLNHLIDPSRALVTEEMICSALAMLNDVNTGDK